MKRMRNDSSKYFVCVFYGGWAVDKFPTKALEVRKYLEMVN